MTALLLDSPVMHYAWGSTTVIDELLGRKPDGEPDAELWMGAHPAAPSIVADDPEHRSLATVIADDPLRLLGRDVAVRFDDRLPFLLKVLAIERPLSLQAHPTLAQARRGFADENARGIALDAPERNYKDSNHKPELVCALTPFAGLCGFRPVAGSVELLDAIGASSLLSYRERLLADGGLRDVVTDLLSMDESRSAELVVDLLPGASRLSEAGGAWSAEAGWLVELAREYPRDRGVVIAALLNLVHLAPGEALFLPAGVLHAYLGGTAVELMASSDNVLRGGLTSKHIDVAELVSVLDFVETTATALHAVAQDGGMPWFPNVIRDFRLGRAELARDSIDSAAGKPRLFFCASGNAELGLDAPLVALPRGAAAFMPASDATSVRAADTALVFVATTGVVD